MIEQIKKIAEQVEENESKKLLLESEITHLEEVLKHGVSSRFAEENAIYIYSPKTGHEIRRKLEEDYKLIHSKLSIPKKIAEELDDKNSTLNNFNWQFFMQNHRQSFWSYSNELNEYAKDIHNYEAICAYLNPVTKLFVEVEG
ncbi:hypothetical protein [Lactococcus formosensis]|uniref:hypothetical protein n=1 Tax=Lactococcus formosensis TaxID=1281486 RepID=UPI0022E5B03A|nr:hypothetical protein [Lactococcus formosensis]